MDLALPNDDLILPFSVEALDVRGRVAHFGDALDAILSRHDYPEPVSRLLGECVVLTGLLGSTLKVDGRFVLQIQSDGPISLVVTDLESPNRLRGYARFDREAVDRLAKAGSARTLPQLVGTGHMALTIDPGPTLRRYQGIVALNGESLEEVAHAYFAQSEQIPTYIRLAVAETLDRRPGREPRRHWRGGGLSIQFLPERQDRIVHRDLSPGDVPQGALPREEDDGDDDAWVEARARAETLQDHELIDPEVAPPRLLLRLFNQRDVRVFDALPIVEKCHCSRERVSTMLSQFGAEDRHSMIEDGRVIVTCEFCNTRYEFAPSELEPQ